MADNNYGIYVTTDLNQALGYQGTVTVPCTAQAKDFSPAAGVTALKMASVTLSSFSDFTGSTDFTVTTLTANDTTEPYTTFNITVTNPNVPWGNVLDTVYVVVSSYGTGLSGGVTGTMYSGSSASLGYELSSIGIWPDEQTHARLYVTGHI